MPRFHPPTPSERAGEEDHPFMCRAENNTPPPLREELRSGFFHLCAEPKRKSSLPFGEGRGGVQ